jgi:glutathione S-transferase
MQRQQYYFIFQLSLADVYFMDVVSRILDKDAKVLDKFPKLAANLKSTQSLPKVADYLAKRPTTEL